MNKIYFRKGRNWYYDEATKIVQKTKTFKILAKTPTLFLSSQRIFDYQKKYYTTLMKRIEKSDVHIQYLFSLPFTKDEIINRARKDMTTTVSDLEKWLSFSNHKYINLRYIEAHNTFSCVIGDTNTAVLMIYPSGERGCIVVSNDSVPFYTESFNELFKNAKSDHQYIIEEIKKIIKTI